MYRNEEYWNTCSLLATHGFLCMLTMELTGQFAQGIDEAAAEGLARRGLAMWRTLYQRENEDPSSNFYQRVCPRACASGYSLGGGSVQSVAYFADAEDGIECIAPSCTLGTAATHCASPTSALTLARIPALRHSATARR